MINDLTGKVALVTGGSRGIGKAVTLALASQDCDVVINYVSNDDNARTVAAEVEKLGRKALCVKADVSKSQEVKRLHAEAKSHFARPVQILVNNAGISPLPS